jgi:hypothetical protein
VSACGCWASTVRIIKRVFYCATAVTLLMEKKSFRQTTAAFFVSRSHNDSVIRTSRDGEVVSLFTRVVEMSCVRGVDAERRIT